MRYCIACCPPYGQEHKSDPCVLESAVITEFYASGPRARTPPESALDLVADDTQEDGEGEETREEGGVDHQEGGAGALTDLDVWTAYSETLMLIRLHRALSGTPRCLDLITKWFLPW